MTLYNDKYRIESARMTGRDYASPGYYFVTICVNDRANLFGEIARRYWEEIPAQWAHDEENVSVKEE